MLSDMLSGGNSKSINPGQKRMHWLRRDKKKCLKTYPHDKDQGGRYVVVHTSNLGPPLEDRDVVTGKGVGNVRTGLSINSKTLGAHLCQYKKGKQEQNREKKSNVTKFEIDNVGDVSAYH